MPERTRVVKIKLPLANAYVLAGNCTVLVDTGAPGDHARIVAALAREGIAPRDIALILLTHGHGDHAGSARALRALTGAPVALHVADVDMVRRGRNRSLSATRWTARILRPFVDKPFEAFEPDICFKDESSLASFGGHGMPGRVIHTPGHTAGSVSVLVEDVAIAGDVMMGGHLGGEIWPVQPRLHYFAEDRIALRQSIARLIALVPRTWYVGHGGPVTMADVERVFG